LGRVAIAHVDRNERAVEADVVTCLAREWRNGVVFEYVELIGTDFVLRQLTVTNFEGHLGQLLIRLIRERESTVAGTLQKLVGNNFALLKVGSYHYDLTSCRMLKLIHVVVPGEVQVSNHHASLYLDLFC
jgi:hypothetical protein